MQQLSVSRFNKILSVLLGGALCFVIGAYSSQSLNASNKKSSNEGRHQISVIYHPIEKRVFVFSVDTVTGEWGWDRLLF